MKRVLVLLFVLSGCVAGAEKRASSGESAQGPPPPSGQRSAAWLISKTPPPIQDAEPESEAEAGWVWARGYWRWTGVRYVWVPAYWERERPEWAWQLPGGR